jgi:predicted PurR-regulated permease PerM
MNELTNSPLNEPEPSVAYARQAWGRVGTHLRSLTPSQLTRSVMVIGLIGLLGWLAVRTWPALAPFAVGATIAYVLLPVVNWLDRFLPRAVAVLLTLGVVLGFIAYFLAQLLPPIGQQITYVYTNLPDQTEWEGMVDDINTRVATLPGPIQVTVGNILGEAVSGFQSKLDNSIRGLVDAGLAGIMTLFNTIGFVLGFLVIPAWLLDVLRDEQEGVRSVNRLLPEWMRLDFWAIVRLIDRPFRAFVQGQLILSVAVGIGFYLGLSIFEFLGFGEIRYKVLVAVVAGMFQLIPTLGPIVAAVVLFLLGLLRGPEIAIAALVIHFATQWLVGMFVSPHLERRYIDIHPALLLMVIVMISELGLLWVLVAAPITVALRDVFRYVYGRVSDPPRPAGMLPGVPTHLLPHSTLVPSFNAPQPQVPLAYKHGRARKQPPAVTQETT